MEESNRTRLMRDGARRKLDRLRNALGKSYFGREDRLLKKAGREASAPTAAKQP